MINSVVRSECKTELGKQEPKSSVSQMKGWMLGGAEAMTRLKTPHRRSCCYNIDKQHKRLYSVRQGLNAIVPAQDYPTTFVRCRTSNSSFQEQGTFMGVQRGMLLMTIALSTAVRLIPIPSSCICCSLLFLKLSSGDSDVWARAGAVSWGPAAGRCYTALGRSKRRDDR